MNKNANQVRIIGGKWRGRKIKIASGQGVRPTTDMVRETLFNWLAPVIESAVCLDLFAGSGALGFEAASRGAKRVVMIDKAQKVAQVLRENIERLEADNVDVYCTKVTAERLPPFAMQFDVIFLDPPFGKGLIMPVWRALDAAGCFADGAYLYIESEKGLEITPISGDWQECRAKQAGQLAYYLFKRR